MDGGDGAQGQACGVHIGLLPDIGTLHANPRFGLARFPGPPDRDRAARIPIAVLQSTPTQSSAGQREKENLT